LVNKLNTILLFDIGNTRITLGAYRGDDLIATWHLTTRVEGTADEYAVLLRRSSDKKARTASHSMAARSSPPSHRLPLPFKNYAPATSISSRSSSART
jgi:pantothenate kinase type III